ncbi:N-acetylmuramoyl-L-alanine amidase [Priestia endophytica]|uniref:N-acetylmuramoyl-L-alanine amidase n=1 Tax=Priestia endophytica TaxID=135735 RepID=UPI000DCA43E3|nr:N-acetylmuramoyl-L-alanine amidase [Priestia endophytica]RAS74441.1 hypothetical protein A4R27_24160 [Priestia endophytica]
MTYKVKIDSGHGGSDPGAGGYNIFEKDVVLRIAKYMKDHLDKYYPAINASLTRTTDVFWTLNKRTDIANREKVDAFVSIHINSSGNPDAKGFETFRYPGTKGDTERLQACLHDAIMEVNKQYGAPTDRGKRTGNLYVLRETNMPATLTENLFISNVDDKNLLKNEAYVKSIGIAHAQGVATFFGQKIVNFVNDIPTESVKNPFASPRKEESNVDIGKLPVSEHFQSEVKKAKGVGITDGSRPRDNAKREEVMVLCYRTFKAALEAVELEGYQQQELYKTFQGVKEKLPLQKPEEWEGKLNSGQFKINDLIYLIGQLLFHSYE